ncbi:DUF2634 domain-containing protein [Mesobacillus zeae]|uniref:DUF2634 domain-containing protein n=1 Tax=Mesobacillus zeae TaxID=1917180 RepID=A0A398B6D3_9BACI|nr:DUF2634 domain-containing protein [Mesobacillus zeae]RID85014.1 DUF2634 domain-containing protein [Mesobacillus zeae]
MISPKIIDGDLVFENGDWIFAEGNEELVQSVEAILQTSKGEFFLEEEHGLSHSNLVGKEANQEEVRDDIIEALSQEERIASVRDITFFDNKKIRHRTVNITLEKGDGSQLTLEEVSLDAG